MIEQILEVNVTWWLYHLVQTWLAFLSLVVATDGGLNAIEGDMDNMARTAYITGFFAGVLGMTLTLVVL
jgi:hypothetical protein